MDPNDDDQLEEGELKSDDEDQEIITAKEDTPPSRSPERKPSLSPPVVSNQSSPSRSSPIKQIRRERNQNEKEAMLITMRTRLIEARSRELDLKLKKRFPSTSISCSTTSTIPTTITSKSIPDRPDALVTTLEDKTFMWPGNLIKCTETEPVIQFSVNPWASENPIRDFLVSKKMLDMPPISSPTEDIVTYETSLQGPKTPPDNQVLTLTDEKIDWPSHLIKITSTKPFLQYSSNPDSEKFKLSIVDIKQEITSTKSKSKRKHKHRKSPHRKRSKLDKPEEPINRYYTTGEGIEMDFLWYYNYYRQSYEMDQNQATHQAFYAVITFGSYDHDALQQWLNSRDCSLASNEDAVSFKDVDMDNSDLHFTVIKSHKEITLPNGQLLPSGTIQTFVHPNPRSSVGISTTYVDFL